MSVFTLLDFQQVLTRVYDEPNNRLRTDASLSIDSAVISVNIDDVTDSVKIGNGAGVFANVSSDRSLQVANVGDLVKEAYDTILATYPTTSSEVYTYKSGATTVAVVTVTYTSSSKVDLQSVVRT
jgi:hypothetical protein